MKLSREHPPRKILIVKLSAIGDVLQTLPMVESLKDHFPQVEIDWVVEEEAANVIQGNPLLNRVMVSRRKSWLNHFIIGGKPWRTLREIRDFIHDLRRTEYDWVIDNHGILKSGIIVFLSRGRRKIGFQAEKGIADEGNYLFTQERYQALDIERHALERYLDLAAQLGAPSEKRSWRWIVEENIKERVEGILRQIELSGRPLVAVHPMAKWATKNWPKENWVQLADGLTAKGASVVFTGSPADNPAVQEIMVQLRDGARVRNVAGKTTLKELAGLFSRADLVVSTDTGPMHLAAATGTPLIALFGPTAPWRTGPYGEGNEILRQELACSPCFQKNCSTMECMKTIPVEKVLKAAENKLREGFQGSRVPGSKEDPK